MRGAGERGYTLLELIAVIAILASLFGLGLGYLTRTGNDLDRAAAQFRDLARAARHNARFFATESRLVVDPPPDVPLSLADGELRRIHLVSLVPVAEWNFDLRGRAGAASSGARGSAGLDGELLGAEVVAGGRFGNALRADPDAGQPGMRVDLRRLAAFDLRRGFAASVDLRLGRAEAAELGQAIVLRLGQSFSLGIGRGLAPRASVTFVGTGGRAGRTARLEARRPVPIDRWFELALAVDEDSARLLVDGIELVRAPVAAEVFLDPKAALLVSDGAEPFGGLVDTVEIAAFERVSSVELPQAVELVSGPGVVHFAPGGAIDRRFHRLPPVYVFRSVSGSVSAAAGQGVEARVRFEQGGLTR